ncbi:hypothetical protein [Methylobacterium indicum]|uniref:hypothetical protein n=1 Tax=Methylobacterium indicum TaxID=1775910 RepID=UPI002434E95D|nr:hypothetical protein [Methylobacterium indicum]
MVTPLCDTSILIDFLVGREQAAQVYRARWIKLPDAIILGLGTGPWPDAGHGTRH